MTDTEKMRIYADRVAENGAGLLIGNNSLSYFEKTNNSLLYFEKTFAELLRLHEKCVSLEAYTVQREGTT